jgi:tRNA 2-thiouridine synthesizing protein E
MNQSVNKLSTEYQVARDPDGYLFDPLDWNEAVACQLATEEGIELNEAHWPVLRYMRERWTTNRIAPDVRHVMEFLARELGIDKKAAKTHLYKLFPYGYVKQACKIAGMQRPRVWSTG